MEDTMSAVKSSPENAQSSTVQRYKRQGQICEILSAVALTAGAALLLYGIRSRDTVEIVAAAISFVFAIALFVAAAWCSAKVDSELERASRESLYVISTHRIETLKQVKAPEDVTKFLESIEHPRPIGEDQLLNELRKALGSERTNEIKNIVMKYTRTDPEQASDSQNEAQVG